MEYIGRAAAVAEKVVPAGREVAAGEDKAQKRNRVASAILPPTRY